MAVNLVPIVTSVVGLLLDRKKSKDEKKEAVKQAVADAGSAVVEGKKSTALSVPFMIATAVLSSLELDPALSETALPLIQQVVAGLFGAISLGLLTWNKRKDD